MALQPLRRRESSHTQSPPSSSDISPSDALSPSQGLLSRCSAGYRPFILLIALCGLLYLPGITSLPPTDRDEARYLQATRQMMETGDYVRIKVQQVEREKKPVGIHWLQVLATRPLGGAAAPVWAYRLPSVVGAILAVLMTFWLGARLVSREAAFLGATALGSSLVLVAEAHLAKTDAVLLATTVTAIGLLVSAFAGAPLRRGEAILLWCALAVGALVKGPVLPGLAVTTTLALVALFPTTRAAALRSVRPLLGLPLAAMIVAPWVIAITIATGGSFFSRAIAGDIAPKLVGVHESHGGFPGYYAALLLLTFWPWSLFVAPALESAWMSRSSAAVRALAAWLIPAWLVIELVPTKLPHYSLPLFPPLALFVGHWLTTAPSWSSTRGRIAKIVTRGWLVVTGALGVLFVGAAIAFGPWYLLSAVPLALVLAFVARHLWQPIERPPLIVVRSLVLTALFVFPLFFGVLFPGLQAFWLSRSLQRELALWPVEKASTIVIAGYKEPSAVFLLGTDIVVTDGVGAAAAIREGSATIAVVEQREYDTFSRSLGACHDSLERGSQVTGFNYSKGKFMTLQLVRRNEPCLTNTNSSIPSDDSLR